MPGGDSELLLLMTNPKLPGDTRFILMDPLHCLELEFADLIADTVQRQSHLENSHDWREFDGVKYNSVAEAAKARFLAMPQFEATEVHVHMKGRGKHYKNTDDISPTPVVSKLVHVLKVAYKRGKGDVVFLANDYGYDFQAKKLSTKDDMHMTAFTVGAARKLLAKFDSEIKPILEDVKSKDFMHIGVVLKRYMFSTLKWDADISFGWLVPTFGHVLHFQNPIIQPIRNDFDWTRIEYWDYGWVGDMSMWRNSDKMSKVEIFEMTHDECLKFVCHVPLHFPLERQACWITYIDPPHLQPQSDKSIAEYLKIDGEFKVAYDLPHPVESFPEQDLGFHDHTERGEKPSKRFKRGFRSGRVRYKNRIWTSKQTEAASPQCSHRFCLWLFFFIQIVLF